MTKFLHNTWFKCITVLLVISIVSGGLLALLNDVLYVSSQERTSRAVKKIYGESILIEDDDIVLDVDSIDIAKNKEIEYDFGRITKVFNVNGDLLLQTEGYQGYKNGTVTLWIRAVNNQGKFSIDKIIMESYKKQTLMSKFGDSYFSNFYLTDITQAYKENKLFAPTSGENANPNSGATKSATACCNAVNCAIKYIGDPADAK